MEHRDWNLQLVDPGSLELDLSVTTEIFDPSVVSGRVAEARQQLADGKTDLAVLVAFGALEAAMRIVVRDEKLRWDRINVLTLIATLLEAGYFDTDDVTVVKNMLDLRNALAYGFSSSHVDAQKIVRLIELTDELID